MSSLLMRLCCCCCVGPASHTGNGSNDGSARTAGSGAYSPVGIDALSPDRDSMDGPPRGLNGTAAADQFEIEIDEMEDAAEEEDKLALAVGGRSQRAEKEEREDEEEDDNAAVSAPLQRTAVEMQPLASAGRASPRPGNGLTPQRGASPRPPVTILAPPPAALVYSFPAPPSIASASASSAVLSTPSSASSASAAAAPTASRSPDSLVTSSDLERDDTDYDIQRFRLALEEVESKILMEDAAPAVAAKTSGSMVPPPARPSPVLLPRSKLIAAAARGTGSASARASNEGPLTFIPAHATNGPPHLSNALPTVRKNSSAASGTRSVPSSPAVDVSNLLMRSQQQQQPLANGNGTHKPTLQPSSIRLQQQPPKQHPSLKQSHAPPSLAMSAAQHALHMVHSPSAPALSAIMPAIPDAPVEPASPRTTAQLEKLAEQGSAAASAAAVKQAAADDSVIPEEETALEATSPADIPTVAIADLHARPIVSPPRTLPSAAAAAPAAAPAVVVPAVAQASTTVPASAVAAPVASVVKPVAPASAAAAAAAVGPSKAAAAPTAPASASKPSSAAAKKHASHAHSNPLDRLGVPGGVISSAHMEELMSALKGAPSACADDGALISVDEVSYAHLFAFLAGTNRTLPGKVVKPFVIPELQALIAAHTQAAQHARGGRNGAGAGMHPPQLKRSASVSTAHSAPHAASGASSSSHAHSAAGAASAAAPVTPKVGSALSPEAAKLLLSFMHWLVDIRIDRPALSSSAAAAAALSTLTLRFDFGPAASGAYSYIDLPSQPTWVLGSKHPRDPYLVHPLNQPKIYTNESHRLCIHRELALSFSAAKGIISIRSGDVSLKKSFVSLNCDLRTEYRPGMVEYDDSRNPFLVMREDDESKPVITDDGHYLPRTFDCWLVVTVLTRETWVGLPIIGKQAPPDRNMKPHAGYPYP